MIKVIIVEDKPPILWSIRQKIEAYSPEIQVIGEALNGQEALTLITELKPDIVFTDIKMPVMDGLQLISEVKKTKNYATFVVISGYDDFKYAQQAIKLQVTDYILKPITQESINDVLSKITNNIKVVTLQQEKKLLKDLLNLSENVDISSIKLDCDYFISAFFCASSYTSQILDYANPFNFFWSKIDINSLISRHLHDNAIYWYFDGKSLNEMILLIGIPNHCNLNIKQTLFGVSEELMSMGIPVSIAVSDKIPSLSGIGTETQSTRKLLRKYLIFGKTSIIFSDIVNNTQSSSKFIWDSTLNKKLTAFIEKHQKSLFLIELEKIIEYWNKNSFTQHSIKNWLKNITQICANATLGQSDFSMDFELEIEEVLCIAKDYTSLQSGLASIFDQFFPSSHVQTHKHQPMKEIVEKVELYIKTNFAHQITINDIAEKVRVDPCHLSKAFKNIKKISPMEYLTNLRIEKSKQLMIHEPSLMLKDIAEIVGYTNQYYFSRIFKIVTGLSPTDYKSSILTKIL